MARSHHTVICFERCDAQGIAGLWQHDVEALPRSRKGVRL